MKYLVFLTIKIPTFPKYYIQIAKELELRTHPNITDEIAVYDYFCNVEKIAYDIIDDLGIIYLIAIEGAPRPDSECDAPEALKREAASLNRLGWWLNDCCYGEIN